MDNELSLLMKSAVEANELSYSPYSHFRVSASLLLKNGEIITGVNIENSSYSLTMCAERSALFRAYSMGYKKEDIKGILIYNNNSDSMPYPCGACRQVMSELMDKDAFVYIINGNRNVKQSFVKELLPYAFGPEQLK